MTNKRMFVEVDAENIPGSKDRATLIGEGDNVTLVLSAPAEDGVAVSLIDQTDPTTNAWVQLISNYGNLSPKQVIQHLKTLRITNSQRVIANKTSLSEQDISALLRLDAADPRLLEAVDKGTVSFSAIEPLLALPQDEQAKLVPAALQKKTVRGIKSLINAHKLSRSPILESRETLEEEVDTDQVFVVELLREAMNVITQAHAIAEGMTFTPATRKDVSGLVEKINTKIYSLGVKEDAIS